MFPGLLVPTWSDEKQTRAQVVALMVGGLWVRIGEREEWASSLRETWPIRETMLLTAQLEGEQRCD